MWTQMMSMLMLFMSKNQRRLLLHPLRVQRLSLAALLSVHQHVRTCGSCSCWLSCFVTVCACFAAVESSKKPKTLDELTCVCQLQKLEAAFTFVGVSVSPDGEL
jgi:hypothetical protein